MVKNNVLNKQIQSIRSFVLLAIVVLIATISLPAHAKTAYVSDQLQIPLRSGASNGHRIIKFLNSGTAFTVLDTSEDEKFTEIELSDGKSGWIETKNIMDVPSGRARLVSVNKKLVDIRQENKDLKNTIATLRSETKQLKNEKGTLQNERTNLSNSLDDLKITAANPLSLSKKNKELKKYLDKAETNVAMLEKDNQQLRSNVTQEWFMIGGGVSIGSLIVGLILTRINWRRKRDNWGDSF